MIGTIASKKTNTQFESTRPNTVIDSSALMSHGAMALFAGFIPVLAGMSVYLRYDRANTKLNAAVTLYGLQDDRCYKIYLQQKLPELWKQTWFPILVIFLKPYAFASGEINIL
jgi:hypothetical protein